MLQDVKLRYGREPLQIPVPEDFAGQRSREEPEIFLTTIPVALTPDEIKLCQDFVESLPYKQALVKGTLWLDRDDPLLDADHDRLDALEANAKLPNSRHVKGSGERSLYERVLLIRESGYYAHNLKQLSSAK